MSGSRGGGKAKKKDLTDMVLGGYDSKAKDGYSRNNPVPIPNAAKLKPAIRNNRAKPKKPNKFRRVTWAPSVYDPVPSASTIERHKQPKSKSESKKNTDTRKGGRKK